MDEKFIEQAEENIRRALEVSISNIRSTPRLPAVGYCHNCSEPLEGAKLFCDADCNSDWEHRRRLATVRGSL